MKYIDKIIDFVGLVGDFVIYIFASFFKFVLNPFKKTLQSSKKILRITPLRKSFILGILFSIFFVFIPVVIYRWFKELPAPDTLVIEASKKSTVILDRNGKLLYEIYVDKNYNPVKLEEVPGFVIKATLAAEDDKFYEHYGIRVDSVIRAIKNNLTKKNSLQGGSTITQQLIKNVLLTPERTISRKIKEAVLAILVEAKYSKNEILESVVQ